MMDQSEDYYVRKCVLVSGVKTFVLNKTVEYAK